jgi:hypothetical protein
MSDRSQTSQSDSLQRRLVHLAAEAGRVSTPLPAVDVRSRAHGRVVRNQVVGGLLALIVLSGTAYGLLTREPASRLPSVEPSPTATSMPALSPSPIPSLSSSPVASSSASQTVDTFPSDPQRVMDCPETRFEISTIQPDRAASTHRGKVVTLLHIGGAACLLPLYPDVKIYDAAGRPLRWVPKTLRGYMGGPSTTPARVRLTTGQKASLLIEALAADPVTGDACHPVGSVVYAAQGETLHSLTVSWDGDGDLCFDTLQVHPYLPGGYYVP